VVSPEIKRTGGKLDYLNQSAMICKGSGTTPAKGLVLIFLYKKSSSKNLLKDIDLIRHSCELDSCLNTAFLATKTLYKPWNHRYLEESYRFFSELSWSPNAQRPPNTPNTRHTFANTDIPNA